MEFDEIFDCFLKTNMITQEMIVPLFLIYDQEFHDGKVTAQDIMMLLSHPLAQMQLGSAIEKMLCRIADKRHIEWSTLSDKDGKILMRFRNEQGNTTEQNQ